MVEENFTFYENGAETQVTEAVLSEYYTNYNNAHNKVDIEEANKGDYFKFLNDSQVELVEGDYKTTANYVFKDGYFYILSADSEAMFLYGKGDMSRLEYLYSSIISKAGNATSSSSDAYEDEQDIPYFPTTFNNSIDFHDYEKIEDIQGNAYLLIHNLSNIFVKK
ncbi:hypothetical protein GCM10022291_33850 [Postechiella marina]|uniref:Uncharacterized protein n=2 Tax=Postechiella marina TaxID=943941 RepID=A0ABP8CIH7_9FLAO